MTSINVSSHRPRLFRRRPPRAGRLRGRRGRESERGVGIDHTTQGLTGGTLAAIDGTYNRLLRPHRRLERADHRGGRDDQPASLGGPQ